MARIQPFRALAYDLERVGGLEAVAAPPYDVIDPAQREGLLARSPHNVVEIDLPSAPDGGDQYAHAASVFARWQDEGVLVRDDEEALWALEQDYTGPDGMRRTRRGFFARVTIQDYGPGKVRPHERTHPGPKEDRLRLTRATGANLSPIFSLYDDPDTHVWAALALATHAVPDGKVTDEHGTEHRLYRVTDPAAVHAATDAFGDRELLIADGHHRYETARVYQQEAPGDPGRSHVLMCLVALQDPGLTVFPTHRLLRGLDDARRAALAEALARDWESAPLGSPQALEPLPASDGRIALGYYDGQQPVRLTLRNPETADAALPDRAEPYRRLDTAVLEALLLKGALGMSEDDISHFRGLDYARSLDEAIGLIESGERQAGFFMGATPVAQVRDVAAAGETMPPKSTYFFPKVLTGMVFNPLD